MGGSQSQQSLNFILEEYVLLFEQNNLKIIQDKETEQTFALREQCFANRVEYDHNFKRLTNRHENADCDNILRLRKLWSKQHNGICSNLFKIYTVYEYPLVKLTHEIQARLHERKFFEEVELFSILQSCINAINEEPKYTNLSSNLIFIMPEGMLKLIHLDLVDPNLRAVYNAQYFYSPEKIENFNSPETEQPENLQKQSIFNLGMTILHSAILENPNICYQTSLKRFNKRKLEILLSKMKGAYGENVCELVYKMLEPNHKKRITFDQIQSSINNYFHEQSMSLRSSKNEGKLTISLQPVLNELKSKANDSSLIYSGETFKKNSVHIKSESNLKYGIKSQLEVMLELSYQNSSLPKNHYMLSRTKKARLKQAKQYEWAKENSKENNCSFQQTLAINQNKSLLESQKPNLPMMNVLSENKQGEYKFTESVSKLSQGKCVFVVQKYEDNSSFEGMMQDGLKEGFGKLIYQDGVYYEGNFKQDSINGKGTLYYGANRPAYSGYWIDNKFCGAGVLFNEFPSALFSSFDYSNFNCIGDAWVKFQGNFINDIKEGNGKIYLTNGQIMEGKFANGLLNGQGVFKKATQQRIFGVWTNNVLTSLM